MLKKELSPKGAKKLTKHELKNLTGGEISSLSPQCLSSCFYENEIAIGCAENQSCVTYRCTPTSSTYGNRCQLIRNH